jgi:hypothetical protein
MESWTHGDNPPGWVATKSSTEKAVALVKRSDDDHFGAREGHCDGPTIANSSVWEQMTWGDAAEKQLGKR